MGSPKNVDRQFEEFRSYLQLLVQLAIDPHLQANLDASVVVQLTLLEAHQARDSFRGSGKASSAAWLRKILAAKVAEQVQRIGRGQREVSKPMSYQQTLEDTSSHLEQFFFDENTTPAQQAQREGWALGLAEAISALPHQQREAIALRYWQGWPLQDVASHLGRSPSGAAGLIQQGLNSLREQLKEFHYHFGVAPTWHTGVKHVFRPS